MLQGELTLRHVAWVSLSEHGMPVPWNHLCEASQADKNDSLCSFPPLTISSLSQRHVRRSSKAQASHSLVPRHLSAVQGFPCEVFDRLLRHSGALGLEMRLEVLLRATQGNVWSSRLTLFIFMLMLAITFIPRVEVNDQRLPRHDKPLVTHACVRSQPTSPATANTGVRI